jgi:hypothetical protein
MTNITPLDYVVQNFGANGDASLEELRQSALKELSELRACVVGRLYRGSFIYSLPSGEVFVLGEENRKYDFPSVSEAQAMIDATLAMCGLLIGSLG